MVATAAAATATERQLTSAPPAVAFAVIAHSFFALPLRCSASSLCLLANARFPRAPLHFDFCRRGNFGFGDELRSYWLAESRVGGHGCCSCSAPRSLSLFYLSQTVERKGRHRNRSPEITLTPSRLNEVRVGGSTCASYERAPAPSAIPLSRREGWWGGGGGEAKTM